MATEREIQLSTILLKERIERLTGKKVIFVENKEILTEKDPKISLKAPKRWWNKMIKQIKKKNADYSAEQVRATVGKIWSNLSDSKKSEIRGREGKIYGKAPEKKS
jgi:hypothetical protein